MRLLQNIELKNYTTYKVGGPAEFFIEAKTEEDLIKSLNYAEENNLQVTVLGGGSNVVISDNGLSGLVILNRYEDFSINKDLVTVGSGMSLHDFTLKLLDEGKTGLEFLANIPGSAGGAVAVNAGCYGKYIDAYLVKAKVFEEGKILEVSPDYFEFNYRTSKIKKGHRAFVLSATLKTESGDLEESKKLIEEDRELRDAKHPKDPSCGSFFKNPSRENTAGSLIEKSGLKGFAIGSAEVSEKHCNFLINTGEAKASDIKKLADHVKKIVFEKTGVTLEEEVQYLGNF